MYITRDAGTPMRRPAFMPWHRNTEGDRRVVSRWSGACVKPDQFRVSVGPYAQRSIKWLRSALRAASNIALDGCHRFGRFACAVAIGLGPRVGNASAGAAVA